MVKGGTAHGWERSTCVSRGAPLPPYIKEQGGGRPALYGAPPKRGILLGLQVLVGFHLRKWGKEEGKGGKEGKGTTPLPFSYSD